MPMNWYICPYDNDLRSDGSLAARTPAMYRYIPVEPNPDGSHWEEVEVLGNHIIVKVDAPVAVHATIRGDSDFLAIPDDLSDITTVLRTVLTALGYTSAEIDTIGTTRESFFTMLQAHGRSQIKRNIANTGIDVLAGRKSYVGTPITDLDARMR